MYYICFFVLVQYIRDSVEPPCLLLHVTTKEDSLTRPPRVALLLMATSAITNSEQGTWGTFSEQKANEHSWVHHLQWVTWGQPPEFELQMCVGGCQKQSYIRPLVRSKLHCKTCSFHIYLPFFGLPPLKKHLEKKSVLLLFLFL